MDSSEPVQTGTAGALCRQCEKPLERKPSAKEHHFCSPRCRAIWHRAYKQRKLNEALQIVVEVIKHGDLDAHGQWNLQLAIAAEDLVKAGAEP
jgi:hypothetical protein